MPGTIVIGFDESPPSRDALALGRLLAAGTGGRALVANVYPFEPVLGPEHEARERADSERTLEPALAELTSAGVEAEPRAVAGASSPRGLHDLAASEHADALVVGSSRHGEIGRVLPGSVGERVIHGAPCPVVLAPHGYADQAPSALRSVAVAFDDRPEAWTALQRAAQIAASSGARLRIVLALSAPRAEYSDLAEQFRERASAALGRAATSLSERVQVDTSLVSGNPAEALCQEAASVDLLVTGSRDYGALRQVLLGSVSSELVRSAPCPVLVVPRSVEFDPEAGAMAAADQAASGGH